MFFNILRRDLKRKKSINIILMIFVILASTFIASGANNMVTVFNALDNYFDMAEVPDYWVSTSDSRSSENFKSFADENNYSYKDNTMAMINPKDVKIDGKVFDYSSTTVISRVNDTNLFLENGKQLKSVADGEIYVSSLMWFSDSNDFHKGSKVVIKSGDQSKEFVVKGYVKDAVFGSGMISMTRFLVSDNDFEFFKENEKNVLFDSFFLNTDDSEFNSKFTDLELNVLFSIDRETVKLTYIMDILMSAIVFVVSICLILISLAILRFTIDFTMTEEFREIGVMKAIGISNRGIRGLYIIKYTAISIGGSAIGFILSIPFGSLMLQSTSKNIMISNSGNYALNVMCSALSAFIVVMFCYLCTRKIKRFSPIDAIRNGETGERYSKKGVIHLSNSKLPLILSMSLNDVMSSLKKYVSMFFIFVIGILLVIIPLNIVNTLKSDSFIQTFGMAKSDVIILQETYFDNSGNNKQMLEEKIENIKDYLNENDIESKVFQEAFFKFYISKDDKKTSSIATQGIGDSSCDMYTYLDGTPPQNKNEIAVSHIVADRIDVKIGDDVNVNIGNEVKKYTVTAIYQTMMNMGEGVRFSETEDLDYNHITGCFAIQVLYTDNPNRQTINERNELLAENYPECELMTAAEYVDMLDGGISGQIDGVKILILSVVIFINILVTVLMTKSFITKEKCEIAILKAIGFRNNAIAAWQALRICLILAASTVVGVLIGSPISQFVFSQISSIMGAYNCPIEINTLETFLIYPIGVLLITGVSAFLSSLSVRKISASDTSTNE